MTTNRDAVADLATLRKVCRVCDGDGSFGDARPYRICTECGGTGRDEPTECLKIGAYWIAEAKRLRAEIADLRSREVIEHGGIYYAPLAITNGTWEWFDASDGFCAYVGGESIPRGLYVALPGVNLEKFVMAYPTREAALQALRDAIQAVQQQAQ